MQVWSVLLQILKQKKLLTNSACVCPFPLCECMYMPYLERGFLLSGKRVCLCIDDKYDFIPDFLLPYFYDSPCLKSCLFNVLNTTRASPYGSDRIFTTAYMLTYRYMFIICQNRNSKVQVSTFVTPVTMIWKQRVWRPTVSLSPCFTGKAAWNVDMLCCCFPADFNCFGSVLA